MATKTPNKKLLERLGLRVSCNKEVLRNAPMLSVPQTVEFFKLDRYVSDDVLAEEYFSRGLVPADIHSVALVNKEHDYVVTHWKDASSNWWCSATFYSWGGNRHMNVNRCSNGWGDDWWFAGVRKSFELSRAVEVCKEAGYKVIKEM